MNLMFELEVADVARPSRQVSSGLHLQLRNAILEGRLKPGSRLPSTRNARSLFGVSRNTAQDVYDRLADEGLVAARHGSGTYVADPLPAFERGTIAGLEDGHDPRLNAFWLDAKTVSSIGFWRESELPVPPTRDIIDLRPAPIDPTLFPFATFRQVMARQLRRLETRPAASKSPQWNQGNYLLRQAIAEHLAMTRAVAARPEEVLVTSGAQQAFDLVARTLIKPGQTVVAIEDPGFPPMRVPFAAAGAKLVPVRVDAEGMVIDDIPRNAGIICVCPSHQFPLGMSMSSQRREALVQFARHIGAVIVEDDYDGEFRYDGSPLRALRNASSADLVFYIGSFSKCMLPSLRLGFLIPPAWAARTLVAAKNALDWHCSIPLQLAVAGFIKDGHLGRHVRRMRRVYRQRRDILLDLLVSRLSHRLSPILSAYGLHLAATVTGDIDTEAVSAALAQEGILCHALTRYFLGAPAMTGFVISHASADRAQLEIAVEALARQLG